MAVAKSIFKSIFKGASRGFAGGEGGIPGLLSLWNAKTPTVSAVGPQIQTSVAGNQPDANGNMVQWPVYHPGKGVMVQPAYTNLLQNSKFEGAVSGTPGTSPTNWTVIMAGGSILVAGTSITFSATAARQVHASAVTADANITYTGKLVVGFDGVLQLGEVLTALSPAGTAKTYMVDGAVVATTVVPSAGSHFVEVVLATGGTAGTHTLRIGVGVIANATGTATFSNPQLVASTYQMPYAASGAGATTSVTSTAGDDDPENGMVFLVDSRMAAALSGIFTAAVLVYMGASSAEVTADTNIISINDSVTGGIYAASGGVLKAFDGTNTATVTVAGGWARGETLFIPWWINGAGTGQQIGYKKSAESTITWGAAATYDGSVNPGTHLRWGYTINKNIGAIQLQFWNKSVETDAKLLDLLKYVV